MPPQNRTDETIAALARRSHGVVARARLRAAGVTNDEIRTRLARGSLIALYRGTYRVGHVAPSTEATYMAAVLACGRGAELMGEAASFVYEITKRRPPQPIVKTRTERRIEGIETHRTRAKERGTLWRGIPITTVPRTLMDLVLPDKELVRACHEAQVRFGVRPEQTRGHVREILEGRIPITLSALEHRFLELLREHDLPIPRTNQPSGTKRVDCRWPDQRLTVELDGYCFHNTRHAFESDRRREREAHARGDQHRRYTYGDVFEDARMMLAELRALLA